MSAGEAGNQKLDQQPECKTTLASELVFASHIVPSQFKILIPGRTPTAIVVIVKNCWI